MTQRVLIYGSTGSIGTQALDVVRHHPQRFSIAGLAAGAKLDALAAQIREFRPAVAVIADAPKHGEAAALRAQFKNEGIKTELLEGREALVTIAREAEYDVLLGAITGAAGLPANIEAVKRGKRLALANKESLVMTGPILTDLAARTGSELLPVDSEHSAVWQCLRGERHDEIRRVILTASGGPFRTTPLAELRQVTREQALKHPTWKMGPKITIDSATLFNKALEVIEARWLFNLKREQLDAVIHPQSVVHSMVEFVDRSVMAQLGPTDMRIPIQLALSHPERLDCPVEPMPLNALANLTFEPIDLERFPSMRLGFEVAARGGTAGAVMNGANEVAVSRFLAGELKYLDVYRIVATVCEAHSVKDSPSLEQILEADRWARERAGSL